MKPKQCEESWTEEEKAEDAEDKSRHRSGASFFEPTLGRNMREDALGARWGAWEKRIVAHSHTRIADRRRAGDVVANNWMYVRAKRLKTGRQALGKRHIYIFYLNFSAVFVFFVTAAAQPHCFFQMPRGVVPSVCQMRLIDGLRARSGGGGCQQATLPFRHAWTRWSREWRE